MAAQSTTLHKQSAAGRKARLHRLGRSEPSELGLDALLDLVVKDSKTSCPQQNQESSVASQEQDGLDCPLKAQDPVLVAKRIPKARTVADILTAEMQKDLGLVSVDPAGLAQRSCRLPQTAPFPLLLSLLGKPLLLCKQRREHNKKTHRRI
jgi:hypothetical protein